jgi:hypothetical protein
MLGLVVAVGAADPVVGVAEVVSREPSFLKRVNLLDDKRERHHGKYFFHAAFLKQ